MRHCQGLHWDHLGMYGHPGRLSVHERHVVLEVVGGCCPESFCHCLVLAMEYEHAGGMVGSPCRGVVVVGLVHIRGR